MVDKSYEMLGSLMLLSFFNINIGFILKCINTARREKKRFYYLQFPAIGNDPKSSDNIFEDRERSWRQG